MAGVYTSAGLESYASIDGLKPVDDEFTISFGMHQVQFGS